MGNRAEISEKQELARKKARYARINQLTNEPGWKDLVEVFEEKYHEALEILKNPKFPGEEQQARGAIKLIDGIFDKIESDLKFGRDAQDRYIAKYVKENPEGD